MEPKKCVMVLDGSLPQGVLANTAAILGVTLGKRLPQLVGDDVFDQTGCAHLGIVELPIPVLQSAPEAIRQMRETLYQPDFQDLTVVDFSDLARGCATYREWIDKMAQTPEQALQYLGLAICGPKKKVNKLTGSLPLLR